MRDTPGEGGLLRSVLVDPQLLIYCPLSAISCNLTVKPLSSYQMLMEDMEYHCLREDVFLRLR